MNQGTWTSAGILPGRDLARQFCEIVNDGLSAQVDRLEEAAAIEGNADELAVLVTAYQNALAPMQFSIQRVTAADETFWQAYQLLTIVLDASVVDPPRMLADRFNIPEDDILTFILMVRTWRTAGACRYDSDGHLIDFDFDPLCVTQHIAAAAAGDYISMNSAGRTGEAIMAVGQLVTRSALRYGRGHGRALVRAFEQEAQAIGNARGEILRAALVESEGAAQTFWAKMGYRWVQDSHYHQPPIDWDQETGDPLFEAVPELLMINPLVGSTDQPTSIDAKLLRDVVYAVYEDWYIPQGFTQVLEDRIRAFVFDKLFADFENSLAHHGSETVPLTMPPDYSPSAPPGA